MRIDTVGAIVTGAASGLGAATARALRAAGADVTLVDRDAARGAALAEEIGASFIETDVTSEVSAKAAFAAAKAAMGRVNALVNCAGIATAERVLGRAAYAREFRAHARDQPHRQLQHDPPRHGRNGEQYP
jgi:NAD(P)-dependent dehydrogenase (short-subunit alcohol dehydrogenase family)